MQEMQVWSLGQEDTLEEEMATYSSILAWRIPLSEESGRLYSPYGRKKLDMTKWPSAHTHIYDQVHTHTHTLIYIYIYMYVYIYIYIYIYTHSHTHSLSFPF